MAQKVEEDDKDDDEQDEDEVATAAETKKILKIPKKMANKY